MGTTTSLAPTAERQSVLGTVARGALVLLFLLACTVKVARARMMACDPPENAHAAATDGHLAGR